MKSFAWVTTSCVLVTQAVLCQGLLDQSTEAACHTAGGNWARVWLVDSGDNGMTLELTNTDTSVAVSVPSVHGLILVQHPSCVLAWLAMLFGWLARRVSLQSLLAARRRMRFLFETRWHR